LDYYRRKSNLDLTGCDTAKLGLLVPHWAPGGCDSIAKVKATHLGLMPEQASVLSSMDSNAFDSSLRDRGFGSPEPVGNKSERAGSTRSSSNDCSASLVGDQARMLDTVTGNVRKEMNKEDNPFVGRPALARTPPPNRRDLLNITRTRSGSFGGRGKRLREDGEDGEINEALFHETQTRSQNEQVLYNAWLHEKRAREKLESTIEAMQQQIHELQLLLQKQEFQKETEINQINPPIEYFTDEEELAQEVAWITEKGGKRGKTKKRKKSGSMPESSPKINTNNNAGQQLVEKRERKPPPIIVSQVNNYSSLKTLLTDNEVCFKATALNNEQLKLSIQNPVQYVAAASCLNAEGYKWHSFEDKQTRPIKVMVRNLLASTDPNDIV
jgi:hypothetical protein